MLTFDLLPQSGSSVGRFYTTDPRTSLHILDKAIVIKESRPRIFVCTTHQVV